MIEQWQELKETISEMRDNDGTGTQQEVCNFLVNYMGVLEKQMQDPCEDAISREDALMCLTGEIKETDTIETIIARIVRRIRKLPPVNPTKTGHCKNCKWWKDSDGLYRRGSHAESQCPINRREVFEGNGYCYMFEPQERSGEE